MTSVGARRCGLDGARGARRHDRRSSTRSAARSRNDVLAARRALAVVVAAQGSRRGDGRAATRLSVRRRRSAPGGAAGTAHAAHDDTIGARRRGRRRRDQGTTCSRLGALAVVVSARVSWRGDRQSSNEAEREDDVGRRSAVRPGTAHAAHDDTIGVRRRDRRRDQGTTCSRLGARSPSSWRLRGAGAAMEEQQRG